jgi:hypothetical protein
MKKIVVILFVCALTFAAKNVYSQCVNMGGPWSYTYSGIANCTIGGMPQNIPIDDSGAVIITQNGCNITVDNDTVPNQGTVSGNSMQLTGSLLGSVSGFTFTQNSATVSGTINTEVTSVTATGSGSASGTYNGFLSFSCTATGIQVALTRSVITLTVGKTGAGTGTVTSSPSGINCGVTCSSSFDSSTIVTLTASADADSTFTGWSGSGCSGTGTCIVTMDASKSVTATFGLNQYTLSVSRSGSGSGTVTSEPTGISCGSDCSETYNYGTQVTLTAVPSTGSTFTGWSGGSCGGNGTCTVTMDAAKTVSATFTLNQYTLSVSKSGTGAGTVTSSPSGIDCGSTCSFSYAPGTSMTLTASAEASSYFAGWSLKSCAWDHTCTFALSADKPISATFNPEGYPFTDVPSTHWAISYITELYNAHLTTGYGGINEFKPDYEVSRDQMAAFIIRAKEGEPDATYCDSGCYFSDVDTSGWACKYIQRLYDLSITTGYGGTNQYRPELIVTREQMAAFIIRALEPEPASDYCDSGSPFSDVLSSSWSCRYIKRLYERGITTGYGGTNQYRPELTVTRAQMAAFIGRAFLGMK